MEFSTNSLCGFLGGLQDKSDAYQRGLSPAYDLTFNEGPNGYHQMSVMGEALTVEKKHLLQLAKVAGITKHQAQAIIQHTCDIAQRLTSISQELLPDTVNQTTLNYIQTILHGRVKQMS